MKGRNQDSTPRRRNDHSRAGFTLAEVVVGVLLFGLAATVLTQAVANSLNAYHLSRLEDPLEYPMQRVREHILELRSRTELEEGGEIEVPVAIRDQNGGTARTEVVRVRWEAEISPTKILNYFIVDLSANLESGGNTSDAVETRIMVYRPFWSDSEEEDRLIEVKEEEFKDRLATRGVTEEVEEE